MELSAPLVLDSSNTSGSTRTKESSVCPSNLEEVNGESSRVTPLPQERFRLRLFYEFERPRNGREIILNVPTCHADSHFVPTNLMLSAIKNAIDTTRFTPYVYDTQADCFISLAANPPDSIRADPPAENLSNSSRALWRVDVKLVGGSAGFSTARGLADRLVCDSSRTSLTGNWFGIGIARGKTASNHGSLWRSALQMGAALTFTIGQRYEKKVEGSADIFKTYRQVPCIAYEDLGAFMVSSPIDTQIVAVEYGGTELTEFKHPKRALYVLGSEDSGLPPALVQHAHHHVSIPTADGRPSSLNVAAAGAMIMYDRLQKQRLAQLYNSSNNESSKSRRDVKM